MRPAARLLGPEWRAAGLRPLDRGPDLPGTVVPARAHGAAPREQPPIRRAAGPARRRRAGPRRPRLDDLPESQPERTALLRRDGARDCAAVLGLLVEPRAG